MVHCLWFHQFSIRPWIRKATSHTQFPQYKLECSPQKLMYTESPHFSLSNKRGNISFPRGSVTHLPNTRTHSLSLDNHWRWLYGIIWKKSETNELLELCENIRKLTMVPPLGLLRVLIARLYIECIIRRTLLLPATAEHRRNTKADGRHW